MVSYNPYNLASVGGTRLLRRGEICTGSQVQCLFRLKGIGDDESRFHFNICGALDGRVSILTPISEKQFKRLYALYSKMVVFVQHFAGLNPRGYRQAVVKEKPLVSNIIGGLPGAKMVLDGDLLVQFLGLPVRLQDELSRGLELVLERLWRI